MPIEPPDPHDVEPDLRAIYIALQKLAAERPEPRTLIALGHVAAAVAVLSLPPTEASPRA